MFWWYISSCTKCLLSELLSAKLADYNNKLTHACAAMLNFSYYHFKFFQKVKEPDIDHLIEHLQRRLPELNIYAAFSVLIPQALEREEDACIEK